MAGRGSNYGELLLRATGDMASQQKNRA